MYMLGVKMKCETKVVRRTWGLTIRNGISVERLRGFLDQIPENAVIIAIEEDDDTECTIIEFECEDVEDSPEPSM